MPTPRSSRAAIAASVILAAIASVAPVAAQSPAAPSPRRASPAASVAPRTFGEAWTSVGCADLGILADFDQIADCGYVTVPENRTDGHRRHHQAGRRAHPGDVRHVPERRSSRASADPGANGLARGDPGVGRCPRRHPQGPRLGVLHAARHAGRRALPRLRGLLAAGAERRHAGPHAQGEPRGRSRRVPGVRRGLHGEGRGPGRLQLGRERLGHRGHQGRPGLRHDRLRRRVVWHPAGPVPAP